MPKGKEYVIQFVGLGFGEHVFEYEIKDSFFDEYEYSEIKKGDIGVKVRLHKQSTMMVLQFEINGSVLTNCDLCAEEFDLTIRGDYKLIVKVGGHETGDEDDDIISVAANEHQLALKQFIYEYITLSFPIKRVHPLNKKGEPTCNKETLQKLKKYLIDEEKDETSDPRWNDLKNIKLN